MSNERTPFFRQDGDWFVANDASRGPWSADACHAGPAAGLLARAAELEIADKQLVRLTANFVRPVPMSGVRIETVRGRDGRVASSVSLSMVDRNGKTCALATTSHIVVGSISNLPTPEPAPPQLSNDDPQDFLFSTAPHGQPFFSNFVETRYPPGDNKGLGPKTVWMRTPALLEGELVTPFQSVCPLSDCGNGISFNQQPTEVSCVNPDITIALHRLPESEWLASSAISHWQSTGIGLAQATLYDEKGEIGAALQSLVLRHL